MNQRTPQESPRIDVREYAGRWVALHPESRAVIADGATLKETREAAFKTGVRRPLLMMVPRSNGYFAGFAAQIEVVSAVLRLRRTRT
jgi:hypothetical protein